jgi:hypothetical protein
MGKLVEPSETNIDCSELQAHVISEISAISASVQDGTSMFLPLGFYSGPICSLLDPIHIVTVPHGNIDGGHQICCPSCLLAFVHHLDRTAKSS